MRVADCKKRTLPALKQPKENRDRKNGYAQKSLNFNNEMEMQKWYDTTVLQSPLNIWLVCLKTKMKD